MAGIKQIQSRIKSAKNIAQITKAMQMVAASRMRRAQDAARKATPYRNKIVEMTSELSMHVDPVAHPLLMKKTETKKQLVVLISTNKGLAGGLNTNLFRKVSQWFPDQSATDFVTLGKKGQHYVIRCGSGLVADFSDKEFIMNAQAVTELFIQGFLENTYSHVYLAYNEFINSMKQEPVKMCILPIQIDSSVNNSHTSHAEFLIEPSQDEVLQALLPHYVEVQVRTAILNAVASEHSARMLAMKNATDNAKSLIDEFTLMYNQLRQEKITYEIADMVTARISME